MIGIILAAGAGTRLGNEIPKCLTEVGEYAILERQISEMLRAGILNIHIVVGYRNNLIRDYVSNNPSLSTREMRVTYDENPRYLETNTARSLEIALRSCRAEREHVVFMNGDVVFDDGILTGFFEATGVNDGEITVFMQSKECGEEEIKIVTDGSGGVISIGKYIAPENAEGEGIGINIIPTLLINRTIDELKRCGDKDFFEGAFDVLSSDNLVQAYDIGDKFAVEIDFPEDLRRARDWAQSIEEHMTY